MDLLQLLIIALASLSASCLTFFSGFGLGTILLSVFVIWFPVDQAILMTAIVHFSNNIFKWMITRNQIDPVIFIRFGLPAIVGAILGSLILNYLNEISEFYPIKLMGKQLTLHPMKMVIGILIIVFGIIEFMDFGKKAWSLKSMTIGGMLSGFFGGLSGHQGALRSAFLLRYNLTKEVFIATGIAIACVVDVSRILVYLPKIIAGDFSSHWILILSAILFAFIGAWYGNKYLKKLDFKWVKLITAIGVITVGLFIALGII